MLIIIYIWSFIYIGLPTDAARILAVFPVPSISHQVVFRPITQELAKRGHEVIVVTPNPAFPKGKAPQNLTEIDIHDISYEVWNNEFMKKAKDTAHDIKENFRLILKAFNAFFDHQLQVTEVQQLIKDKSQKFDLLLLEACVRQALIFSHIFKAPVIQVGSLAGIFDNYDVIGAPTHPLLYPTLAHTRLYNLTMLEKARELYNHYAIDEIFRREEENENRILRKHLGSGIPPLRDLNNNVDMLFLNVHPIFDSMRPVPQTVVYLGGLHQNPAKELPTDLKEYLDASSHGVIYMSLGTNVDPSLLSPERVSILVKVFSQLPYNVLLKWHTDDLPGKSENIKIAKWWPQSDILKHPNVKLFITQGGIQSTDEAITAGVPLIGIPMIADQWHNVEKYVHFGIGLQLELKDLTEEILKEAIHKAITNQSYRENIVKFGKIIQDQPQKPLDRAVWWAEYVIRHKGARHLRAPAANISWAQYYEVDLVLTFIGVILGFLVVLLLSLWYIYSYVKQTRQLKIKRN